MKSLFKHFNKKSDGNEMKFYEMEKYAKPRFIKISKKRKKIQ